MRSFRLALLASVLAFSTQAAATEVHCKGNEENYRIFEEMTEVLFNKRDGSQVLKYYAPEFVSHNVDQGGSGPRKVKVAFLQKMWEDSKRTWPDRKLVNEVVICGGDLVVARVTMTGTMEGPMGNIPATGKKFATTATDIYRFKDGKVVERWGNNDQITMLKQLGVLEAVAKGEGARHE
jgi:predicted ester cyclase